MNEQATTEPQETPQTARPLLSGELAAYAYVEKYADGGARCADCRHSTPDGPGYVHICQVLEGEDRARRRLTVGECPALPDDLSDALEANAELTRLAEGQSGGAQRNES